MKIAAIIIGCIVLGIVIGVGYQTISLILDERAAAVRWKQEQIDKQLQRRQHRREGLAAEFQRYKECVQGGERPHICLEN